MGVTPFREGVRDNIPELGKGAKKSGARPLRFHILLRKVQEVSGRTIALPRPRFVSAEEAKSPPSNRH
jgi:hypothetical protein